MKIQRPSQMDPRLIAGGLALLVALWLLSGVGGDAQSKSAPPQAGADTAPLRVMVRDSSAQDLVREAMVSAFTEPLHAVDLRAELSGRISEVLAERGEQVEQGQVLLRLDARDRPAQLAMARDLLAQRELELQAAQRLRRDQHVSEVDLARARSSLSGARADVQRLESELERTEIRAPFAGVLDARPLEAGDFANVGDLLATVMQQASYLVVGHISEDDIAHLHPDQRGRARLSDGREVSGTVHYIAARSDASSRTFRVELRIDNPGNRLIVGTSAALMLPLEQVAAHILEPASLALNRNGEVGIKAVDGQGRVSFHPAQIAQNRDGEVWLTGLPEQLRVITVGQGFVSDGDVVKPVLQP